MDNDEVTVDIHLFYRDCAPLEADVRVAVEKVLSQYNEVQQAYLYGSFINHDAFQDIDIALLLSETMEPYALYKQQMQIAGAIEDLILPYVPCDVRILNGAPVEFQYEVIRTGHIVFCRSKERQIEFEADLMRRYLDLKYLYDRMDQAFLARVSR